MSDEGAYGIGSNHWPGLAKLVEEMGELQAELMKLVAMGGDAFTPHWDGKGQLYDRIIEESGDVRAALIFFCEMNAIPKTLVHARADKKLERFRHWQAEQEK
jgi:NTP pyrophosphatase (non-canonical NTP hydrolase)